MDSEPGYAISQASAAPSVPWGRVLVLLAQKAGQVLPAKAPLLPSQSFPHMAAKVVISKPDRSDPPCHCKEGEKGQCWFPYNQIVTALSDRFLSHLRDLFICESISIVQ